MYLYFLNDLPKEQFIPAGGKARTLAHLKQANYPIPNGFVILPHAFDGDQLRPDSWERIQTAYISLGARRVAVRSSAASEDSATASFAGGFESVLNVDGLDALNKAIHTVYHSRHSDRIAAYEQAQGIQDQQDMAVLVQKMVPADYAGVLFTADPVSGSYRHMVGNFVQGLGEQLVSGEANAEQFTLERPKGQYNGSSHLPKRALRQLFRYAKQMENELGAPQDIEWAIADGKLHLLQSRPITTLIGYNPTTGETNDSLRGEYLWTNTNFGEAVPEVMTPLTWSAFQIFFEETFPFRIPGSHPIGGNIGGRFYLNISMMAAFVKSLGFSWERLKEEGEELIGILPEEVDVPFVPISRLAIIRHLVPSVIRIRRNVLQRRKRLPDFVANGLPLFKDYRQQFSAISDPAGLHHLWHNEIEPYFRQACQMLQAMMGMLDEPSAKLRRELGKLVSDEERAQLIAGASAHTSLKSLGPLLGLHQLAQGDLTEAEYYEQYGHRGANEFELAWPRPEEDLTWLPRQHNLLSQSSLDLETQLHQHNQANEQAWQTFLTQNPRQAKKLHKLHLAVASATQFREEVRSEVTRAFYLVRHFALRAGALTGLDDDIFYLSFDELNALLVGNDTATQHIPQRKATHQKYASLPPYPSIIRGRFDPVKWANSLDRQIHWFDARGKQHKPSSSDLRGFGGAAGVVEGIVRVIHSLDEADTLQDGEILVTNTTNIGWTPLFPRASAIITDIGAPLSHAAIVARELGIPAVVGCGNATAHLKTGDRVRVNGGQGIVAHLPGTSKVSESSADI